MLELYDSEGKLIQPGHYLQEKDFKGSAILKILDAEYHPTNDRFIIVHYRYVGRKRQWNTTKEGVSYWEITNYIPDVYDIWGIETILEED
jgi:hypothetical protein